MQLIAEAAAAARQRCVDLNIMTLPFTDTTIADALVAAAQEPRLNIRLIADWTQRAADGHQQVGRMAEIGLPNVRVRYKKDQPYIWDASVGRMSWSYQASRGMLHHKTLSVVVDGEPTQLVCISSNWSAKAADSYENLLIVTNSTAGCRELMVVNGASARTAANSDQKRNRMMHEKYVVNVNTATVLTGTANMHGRRRAPL